LTKCVRIENADNNVTVYPVIEIWNIDYMTGEEVFDREIPIMHPTQLEEIGIHTHRFLKIREKKA
jgi:hypothetical protein